MDYNEEKKAAIYSDAKRICVFAGPGTGKTTALTGRFLYLVKEKGVLPSNILCVTFTHSTAFKMQQDIAKSGGIVDRNTIGTLHAFCYKIIYNDLKTIGLNWELKLWQEDEKHTLLYISANKIKMFDRFGCNVEELARTISLRKHKDPHEYINLLLNSNQLRRELSRIESECEIAAGKSSNDESSYKLAKDYVYYSYLLNQTSNQMLDFDDLIELTRYIFLHNPQVLNKWASKFEHILVDEFQDLTESEYDIIQSLASVHGSIFGVGDPDQCIYGFRGSTNNYFNKFYESADQKVTFTENFRSSQQIMDFAHEFIKNNNDRLVDATLKCEKNDGPKPLLVYSSDRVSEACFVANEIIKAHKEGVDFDRMAVIYRMNMSSLLFEEVFQSKGIPYKVYKNKEFFTAEEIKIAIAYMRFMVNKDIASLRLIANKPSRFISTFMLNTIAERMDREGKTLQEILFRDYQNQEFKGTLSSIVALLQKYGKTPSNNGDDEFAQGGRNGDDLEKWCVNLLSESGYLAHVFKTGDENKANRIHQLMDMALSFKPDATEGNQNKTTAQQFIEYLTFLGENVSSNEAKKVHMMSVHAAKGLEFDRVFVVDFTNGYMPSGNAESQVEIQEERRIAYVAFTRAADRLYIIDGKGEQGVSTTSSFAGELGKNTYEIQRCAESASVRFTEIETGMHVKDNYGRTGIVKSISAADGMCEVQFWGDYQPRMVARGKLVRDSEYQALSFPIDPEVVAQIKSHVHEKYIVGDIVIHEEYGAGIVTRVCDGDTVVAQFLDKSRTCNIHGSDIIKRSTYKEYKKG